jgi:type II secretory pathway pseudopilin PulG
MLGIGLHNTQLYIIGFARDELSLQNKHVCGNDDDITLRLGIRIAAAIIVVIALVAIYVSWRAEIRSRAELATELAAAKQALTAVEERQQARDAKLADTLGAIAAEKRAVRSPAQIVRDLPNQIPLPVPIGGRQGSGWGVDTA